MSAIIANISSVGTFAQDTVSQYRQIVELANAILTAMGQMVAYVEDEKEKLEKQSMQLAQLDEELRIKVLKLAEAIKLSQEECDRCSEEYRYASDSDDVSYWRNRLATAQKQNSVFNESYEVAVQIQKEISQKKQQFQLLLRALIQMIDALQKNALEVKKIISVLAEETTYNGQALAATLSRLEAYAASIPFGIAGVAASSSNGGYAYGGSGNTKGPKKRKTYKLKKSTFGYDTEGKRHSYKLYFPQAQPVKSMLYELMKGLRHDLREAVMKQLEFVEFQSLRHGFIYRSNGGRRLRIIGVDISDPSFNHLLLLHVGHELYELTKKEEKLAFESRVGHDMAQKSELADRKMKEMAMDFRPVDTVKQFHKNPGITFKSAGSKFFSECFKAYVSEDYDFLNVVKENFGDSYNAFVEIINRLPNR